MCPILLLLDPHSGLSRGFHFMSCTVTCNNSHCFPPSTITKPLLFRLCSIRMKGHGLTITCQCYMVQPNKDYLFSVGNIRKSKYCTTCWLSSCLKLQMIKYKGPDCDPSIQSKCAVYTVWCSPTQVCAFVFYLPINTTPCTVLASQGTGLGFFF